MGRCLTMLAPHAGGVCDVKSPEIFIAQNSRPEKIWASRCAIITSIPSTAPTSRGMG